MKWFLDDLKSWKTEKKIFLSAPTATFLSGTALNQFCFKFIPIQPPFPMVKHEICSECCRQVFNINNCEILTFNLMCRTSLADKKIIANSYHQAFVLLLSVGRFLMHQLEMTISIIIIYITFHTSLPVNIFRGRIN